MKTVGELIKSKGSNVLSITPDSSVYDAIVKMAHHEIGALLVMEGDKVAGIFSERDYARKIILQDKSSKTTQVSEIMTSNVNYAEPDHSVEQCMSLMTQKRFRHLPVMDGDTVIGMLSIGDLVKEIISEQQSTIEMLNTYITA
jgi:CBS domain-containing protein